MSAEHGFQRWCDVAIVGGSAAGLGAALNLARSRRRVIVIDAGQPRNAPAAHMHGYLGHDGRPPAEFAQIARAEVRSYGVEILAGRVADVTGERGRFDVEVVGGGVVHARRVVAATGLVDALPEIAGLAEQWGTGVIHCPYCHGWEVRGQRLVVIATTAMALHQATLFSHLSPHVTVVTNGMIDPSDPALEPLVGRGVEVLVDRATSIVSDADGRLTGVGLASGMTVAGDAVVVSTRFTARTEPFESIELQLAEHPSGLGRTVVADATGVTSVPGVYAAGNVVEPGQQVSMAAATGALVGALVNADLIDDDGTGPHEWDARYGAAQRMWSGNPNGTLVAEVAGLRPGRVLDVGCGEGADAVWLAEQGWQVTALDVAQVALDRGAQVATERGLSIDWLRADPNDDPLPRAAFDLVSLQYPAIPNTPESAALEHLLAAVAPGGTLLVVGHDLADQRHHQHTPAFDAEAYLQPDRIADQLDPEQWVIEVHEHRPRPAGHASHDVDDIVLRARRR